MNRWLSKKNKVNVVSAENIYLTIPKRKKSTIKAVIEYNGPILAPITKGDKVGILNIFISGELKKKIYYQRGNSFGGCNGVGKIVVSV